MKNVRPQAFNDTRNLPWARAVMVAEAKRRTPSDRGRQYRGRYVYAWFSDASPLPFYIGKGTDRRAWDRHEDADGRAMWCQTMRATAQGFKVKVIRDNLTNEGALLLESCLISFVRAMGGDLGNQVSGIRRQERPPLELAPDFCPPPGPEDCACGRAGDESPPEPA